MRHECSTHSQRLTHECSNPNGDRRNDSAGGCGRCGQAGRLAQARPASPHTISLRRGQCARHAGRIRVIPVMTRLLDTSQYGIFGTTTHGC